MEELLRLGLAAVLGGAVIAAACGGRALFRRRLALHRNTPAADLAERYDLPRGRPGVLYFWGDRCVQCISLQEPALQRLSNGNPVVVRKLKAVLEPELTKRFNILTVPSTVVIGSDHRIRSVNVGFADEETLRRQLA